MLIHLAMGTKGLSLAYWEWNPLMWRIFIMLHAYYIIHPFKHYHEFLTDDHTMVKCIVESTRIHIPKIVKITSIWKMPMIFMPVPWAAALTMWGGWWHARSLQAFISPEKQMNIVTTLLVWQIILRWLLCLKPFRAFSKHLLTISQSFILWSLLYNDWIGDPLAIDVKAFSFITHFRKQLHINAFGMLLKCCKRGVMNTNRRTCTWNSYYLLEISIHIFIFRWWWKHWMWL